MLRRSARKSRMERIKNEHIKERMEVKWKPDIIDIIEQKRLQWYGHVKRMPEERIVKLIMDWIPLERRKRGCPKKTWMEGVQAAMITRNLEPNQWRNREERHLVSGRRRQLLKRMDMMCEMLKMGAHTFYWYGVRYCSEPSHCFILSFILCICNFLYSISILCVFCANYSPPQIRHKCAPN